tara:strand:- start:108 stop:656 length:549 start_codon:yes stop_codon:yes gene_type:complete
MTSHFKGLKRNLKYRDKREDGYIFIRFRKELNKNGFHREEWNHPYHRSTQYRAIFDLRYKQSEKGFFNILWQSIKKSGKERGVSNFIESKDRLVELWNDHKKKYGPCCRYTGVNLTTKQSMGKGYNGSTPTNISIDRLDSSLPYTENNIVFCSWEFNQRKSGVLPNDCKLILKVYEEENANK